MKKAFTLAVLLFILVVCLAPETRAQTTEFTYQGSLKDGANPANGNYDFEFLLFDSLTAGTQQGATLTRSNVVVANGTFSAKLDFGSVFPGANRFLEIHVRTTGGGAFTTLAPRQSVGSTPYSVKAVNADNAATATNATQLGGIAAGQYVLTGDARLSDARPPTAGSANYIQNGTLQQASSNFNISGTGKADTFDVVTQFKISGNRILSNGGNSNLFAGQDSANFSTGSQNAFFGYGSGHFNTLGTNNSFFGANAGSNNDQGGNNTYIGADAGFNSSGALANGNTFVGVSAGSGITSGRRNTMLGFQANAPFPSTINNATAIGSNALVTQSDSLVLGSINGVNGSSANTNVGIGTTSPAGRLHIVDNGSNLLFGTPAGCFAGNAGIGFASTLTCTNYSFLGDGLSTVINRPAGGAIYFRENNADQMYIQASTGNVGIATLTPSERLHVVGNGLFTGNLTVNGTLTAALPAGSSSYVQNGTTTQASTNFNIGGNGIIGNRFGVGTASPAARLHVVDNSSNLLFGTPTGGCTQGFGMGIGFASTLTCANFSFLGDGVRTVINRPAGGEIYFRENNVDQMYIQATTGNVGIGTDTPSAKLEVNGDVKVTGTVTGPRTYMVIDSSGITPPSDTPTLIPGLSQTVVVLVPSKLLVQYSVRAWTGNCISCSPALAFLDLMLDGGRANRMNHSLITGLFQTEALISGSWLMSAAPGTHIVELRGTSFGPIVGFGCGACTIRSSLIVQVIPD